MIATRRWRGVGIFAMLASALWLAVGNCSECARHGSLAVGLAWAGFAYALLISFTIAKWAPGWIQSVAWVAGLGASVVGLWMISLLTTRSGPCPWCLTFWAGHYGWVLHQDAWNKRQRVLFVAAMAASLLGLTAVRIDRDAALEVETFALAYLPASSPAPQWIAPGRSIHPDIVLDNGETALIVWTECAPCGRAAAKSGLAAFERAYPKRKVWTWPGGVATLPQSLGTDYLIPPLTFFDDFGMRPDDPPAFVVLRGHKVERIGRLADFRQ